MSGAKFFRTDTLSALTIAQLVGLGMVLGFALLIAGAALAIPIGERIGAGGMAIRVVSLENTADSLQRGTQSLARACGLTNRPRAKVPYGR